MKLKIAVAKYVTLGIILIGCNQESEPIKEVLSFEITQSKTILEVDELAEISIKTNIPYSVAYLNYGTLNERGKSSFSSAPLEGTLYFGNATTGEFSIPITVVDFDGNAVTQTVSFTVVPGNAVKITGITINNFPNKDGVWDPEYPDTDENRLADIFLVFQKIGYWGMQFTEDASEQVWYTSDTKQNQGDLSWNLANENLYVPIFRGFSLALGDDDPPNNTQDVTETIPSGAVVYISEYERIRPSQISYVNEERGLDVTFNIEWP